jgi:hypothetical protein
MSSLLNVGDPENLAQYAVLMWIISPQLEVLSGTSSRSLYNSGILFLTLTA